MDFLAGVDVFAVAVFAVDVVLGPPAEDFFVAVLVAADFFVASDDDREPVPVTFFATDPAADTAVPAAAAADPAAARPVARALFGMLLGRRT